MTRFNLSDHPAMFTDRIVMPHGSEVAENDTYEVIVCRERPGYWFGSLLALSKAPTPQDLPMWWSRWSRELGVVEGLERAVLQWERALDTPRLSYAGPGSIERSTVLRLDRSVAQSASRIELVDGDRMWADVTCMVAEALGLSDAPDGFLAWRYQKWRELVDSGCGRWLTIRQGNRVVCSGGVFWDNGVARLQEIVTAVGLRRSGLATSLVRSLCRQALGKPVVVVAEAGSGAERLYESIGFVPKTVQCAIALSPREIPSFTAG